VCDQHVLQLYATASACFIDGNTYFTIILRAKKSSFSLIQLLLFRNVWLLTRRIVVWTNFLKCVSSTILLNRRILKIDNQTIANQKPIFAHQARVASNLLLVYLRRTQRA